MKSEDLQKVVALEHQKGDYPTKIFRDLNGALGLTTITVLVLIHWITVFGMNL